VTSAYTWGVWQKLLRSYCVMGGLSPGAKRPWRVADRWSISDAEVKNEWSYTYHPQCPVLARCLVKHRDNFTFTLPASVCTPFAFRFRLSSYILRICIFLFVLFLFIFLPFQTTVFSVSNSPIPFPSLLTLLFICLATLSHFSLLRCLYEDVCAQGSGRMYPIPRYQWPCNANYSDSNGGRRQGRVHD